MKKGLTELVFIVDRSGSMAGLEHDTIGGLNATLEAHRAAQGEALVSIVLFDHETNVLYDRLPISEVPPLTKEDYQVRGCTALLDAVGGAVRHIGRVQGYLPEACRPENTIVVITTDGMENASCKFTYDDVKRQISAQEEMGWEFLFLGANIDAAAEAGRIGIAAAQAATYTSDNVGTAVMFNAVCEETVRLRTNAPAPSASWKDSIEEDLTRRKAGK